jgi:arsenate reductase-like glutaredoxin family protein
MAKQASHLYIAKGKKIIHYNMKKDAPSAADITKGMIGPSGNLRAPTFVRGKSIMVGFHEQQYEEFFS